VKECGMGDSKKDIRRGEVVGNKTATTMLDHCLTQIETHGFSEGVDWDTEISKHLTLEEVIGALVRSEYELEYVKGEL